MDGPIISRDMIAAKARAEFARGTGRDDHGFNWHSTAAIAAWQAEWDRCKRKSPSADGRTKVFHGIDCLCSFCAPEVPEKNFPSMQFAPSAECRFDQCQVLTEACPP